MKKATRSIIQKLGLAALFGFLLTLPFMILEFTFNASGSTVNYLVLFGFLWILATLIVALLGSLIQTLRAGSISVRPLTLLLRITGLTVVVMIWGRLVIDQLPCFLGVPNCD